MAIDSAAPSDPRARIFCGTVDPHGVYYAKVFKQNQRLAAHVTADYHGRFLIELIQNGNDAHPRHRFDGEIEVLLASDEGSSGTLYVANRGVPFGTANVDALCEMGLSSKPPGEAIGNKGLGFRSVAHVTDRPEIYSRTIDGIATDRFHGYRFTFAHGAELDALLPTDTLRALARADMPKFYVPIWLEKEPKGVRQFAARGFSTVIRLPLRDETALKAVGDEMVALSRQSAPVLLFLSRLKRLRFRIRGTRLGDTVANAVLRRRERPLVEAENQAALVDLAENGRYLLARRAIPEPEMKQAIADGLSTMQLPDSWQGWQGDGEVALATRIDEGVVHPRLYTFLPMGRDASAPFNGYLHGSFFPSSNRKALDAGIRLNRLVLDHAATLAAETVRWLTGMRWDNAAAELTLGDAARAAVDLIAWENCASLAQEENRQTPSGTHNDAENAPLDLPREVVARIAEAFKVEGIGQAPIVPCLGHWRGDPLLRPAGGPVLWRTPAEARRVPGTLTAFAPEVLAEHGRTAGIAPIWPGLGEERIAALTATLAEHAGDAFRDVMTLQERAQIVAAVAASIPRGKRPDWTRWHGFYRELPAFMERNAAALAGLAVLFCEDGSLRAARTADEAAGSAIAPRRRRRKGVEIEASVFSPPRGAVSEDTLGKELFPPKPLAPYFAFLAEKLPWFGELAHARAFLESGLVAAFESETVLVRISQVVQNEALRKIRVAGLRWAFAIWCRSVAIKRPIALGPQYRLFVPSAGGEFIPAAEAIFSSGWPDETLGRKLQTLLEATPIDIADLNRVRARRLVPPSNPLFGKKRIPEWTRFLGDLGVQRGLKPVPLKPPSSIPVYSLTSFEFCAGLGISDEAAALWRADIEANVAGGARLPSSTRYVIREPLWWLPGQGEHARFSSETREAYASLILDWLDTASIDQFSTEVHHLHFSQADSRRWPTPVAAFLRSATWMPVD